MSHNNDKFLREWCGSLYHILVKDGVIITTQIPAFLKSEFEAKFPGHGYSFNAEIDGPKMVIDLGVQEGTIEYLHHVDVDKRMVRQFPTATKG